MKRDADKLIFESRIEVSIIEDLLRDWLDEHPDADLHHQAVAERAADLLEVLWYEW